MLKRGGVPCEAAGKLMDPTVTVRRVRADELGEVGSECVVIEQVYV